MTSCEVVVIGGGCVGTSVAYHLAEAGCTDVILVEAGLLGSGSTSKAAGGIRLQHADVLNTLLAQRSLREFTNFEELTGHSIYFRQVGYLFLLDSEADLEMFRTAGQMQRDLGIPIEVLSPEDVRDVNPQLVIDDLVGASFCPLDGFATPDAVVQGYAAAARRRGVRITQSAAVSRVIVEDGRATGVDTGSERITASAVVCAAGVASRAVAATAGVDLPVRGERRRIFFTKQSGAVPDASPLTVDFSTGFYFHREGPGLVFAGRELELEDLMAPALRRLPSLGDAPISSSWQGDYEMSPDHNGMVGESEIVRNFYYATGFSGHGFMLSPAVGEHIAELITGRTPTIDLIGLGAQRFSRSGGARPERIVI
ncbi:MAG: FAD-binding oxidoreductase [Jatrophihabitans sp.]